MRRGWNKKLKLKKSGRIKFFYFYNAEFKIYKVIQIVHQIKRRLNQQTVRLFNLFI
jgi:hypothetical protein